jgi:dihydroflavonol-4-reductase
MVKILVTGANGFLASNIIIELLDRGYYVRGMLRKPARLITDHPDLEAFYGNITEAEDVMRAVKGCSIVIHSASVTDQSLPEYSDYETVNVGGTYNILKACLEHKIQRLIYVSTANVFGYGTREFPGNEEIPIRFPFTRSDYAISKAAAQDMIFKTMSGSGTVINVVNPAFMIGPNDTRISSNRIILRALGKRILFLPPGGKNFIHVNDAASGICNAIDLAKDNDCYLLANENLSYREFYARLAEVTGKKPILITLPRFLLLMFGIAGSILRYTGIRTPISLTNMQIISLNNYYTGIKAVKTLNLPQTPVEKAIRDAISWFRDQGRITR